MKCGPISFFASSLLPGFGFASKLFIVGGIVGAFGRLFAGIALFTRPPHDLALAADRRIHDRSGWKARVTKVRKESARG